MVINVKSKLKNVIHKLKTNSSDQYDKDYEVFYRIIYSISFSVCEDVDLSYTITKSVIHKLKTLSEDENYDNEIIKLCNATKNEAKLFMKPGYSMEGYNLNDDIKQIDMDNISDVDEYMKFSSSLDDSNKDVVALKLIGGFKLKEIADILNMPVKQVRAKINYKSKNINLKLIISFLVTLVFAALFAFNLYTNLNPETELTNAAVEEVKTSISIMSIIYGICLLISIIISIYFIYRNCCDDIEIE